MIIKKIDIENFGKFSGKSIDFKPGFNLIFGKNEDGKSTLMSFIKLMFYGNSGGKGSDISKNPRRKYAPWNGSPMSGAIEFESEEKILRLHKDFKKSAATDKITVYDMNSGEKSAFSGNCEPGQEFFDMEIGEFERSVFIEGYGGFSSDASGDSLAMRIANLSVSGDESFSQSTVQARIAAAREELVSKNGKKGLLVEEELRLEHLKAKLEQLQAQNESQFQLMSDISKIKKEIELLETDLENISAAKTAETAKKDLNAFKTLMTKFEDREQLREQLKKYNLPEDELQRILSECKALKKNISESYTPVLNQDTASISDSEFNSILELEKQSSALDADFDRINGAIRRSDDALKQQIGSEIKKIRIFSASILVLSVITAAVIAFLLPKIFYAGIPLVLLGICAFALMRKGIGQKVLKKVSVQLAKQGFESQLRILSFYYDNLTEMSVEEILAECNSKKQACTDSISQKLEYYGCSSIDELGKKTVSAHNMQFASATDTLNKLKSQFISHVTPIRNTDSYEQAVSLIAEIQDIIEKINAINHDIDTISGTVVQGKISPDFIASQIKVLSKVVENASEYDDAPQKSADVIKAELSVKRHELGEMQSRINIPDVSEDQLSAQIEESNSRLKEYSDRYESLNLVSTAMDAAIAEMSKGLGSHLSQKTGEYLKMMTDGKYGDVLVSRDLNVEARSDSSQGFHEWKYLSAGAIDKVYLALRLAATDIIAEKHNPLPLFFDDILTQYDDESCRNTLSFLKNYFETSGSVSQIFFFTCHNHIAEMAKEVIPQLNEITL